MYHCKPYSGKYKSHDATNNYLRCGVVVQVHSAHTHYQSQSKTAAYYDDPP